MLGDRINRMDRSRLRTLCRVPCIRIWRRFTRKPFNSRREVPSRLSPYDLSGGDITHAVPDNTGYITEGQLYLRRDSDVGKVIVDPFRSLSRLKQLVTGKKTREDHPQVMNAAVRLYADAANAKTKLENGFDLTDYDNRTLSSPRYYFFYAVGYRRKLGYDGDAGRSGDCSLDISARRR